MLFNKSKRYVLVMQKTSLSGDIEKRKISVYHSDFGTSVQTASEYGYRFYGIFEEKTDRRFKARCLPRFVDNEDFGGQSEEKFKNSYAAYIRRKHLLYLTRLKKSFQEFKNLGLDSKTAYMLAVKQERR